MTPPSAVKYSVAFVVVADSDGEMFNDDVSNAAGPTTSSGAVPFTIFTDASDTDAEHNQLPPPPFTIFDENEHNKDSNVQLKDAKPNKGLQVLLIG